MPSRLVFSILRYRPRRSLAYRKASWMWSRDKEVWYSLPVRPGSGKSTTLASLINLLNDNYPYHIITLEDPIEYLHRHKKSIVNQREMGSDTGSYASGLRAALREDPDVILVGEMRDLETIAIAITAAETGHLVFSTAAHRRRSQHDRPYYRRFFRRTSSSRSARSWPTFS